MLTTIAVGNIYLFYCSGPFAKNHALPCIIYPKLYEPPKNKGDDYICFNNGGFGTAVYHIRAYRIIPLM